MHNLLNQDFHVQDSQDSSQDLLYGTMYNKIKKRFCSSESNWDEVAILVDQVIITFLGSQD